jgi:hypothetical protein
MSTTSPIGTLLGRYQRCCEIRSGEYLLVGEVVTGPRWTWAASLVVRRFAIVLGGHFRTGFSDSRPLPQGIESAVSWPRPRATAEGA